MTRAQRKPPSCTNGPTVVRRNRASPSRIVKLYKHLTEPQRKMIEDANFGGLLKIATPTIPAELANWLLVDCFDSETMELVLPGRGRISLTAAAVSDILGLPNEGGKVNYELTVEAIDFMQEKYDTDRGTAPKIDAIVKRVKANKDANEDFLRSWLMLVVSTFLCPPTSLGISPRCYPSLVDLSIVKDLNWARFVVDQFKVAASKMGKKDSVTVCLLLLVVLYVDSLDVGSLHIPICKPRVAAWSRKLLDQVIKLDTNRDGSFGKLKKKRRLSDAVSKVICGLTELMGTFVQEVGEIDAEKGASTAAPSLRRSDRNRNCAQVEPDLSDEETPDDSDYKDEEEDEPQSTDNESQGLTPEDEEVWEEGYMPGASYGIPTPSHANAEQEPRPNSSTEVNRANHNQALQPIADVASEGNTEEHAEADGKGDSGHHAEVDGEDDKEDNVPLIRRLRAISRSTKQDCTGTAPTCIQPTPVEVVPPPAKKLCTLKSRFHRLRLPQTMSAKENNNGEGCSFRTYSCADNVLQAKAPTTPIVRSDSLDFTPPDFDIMKHVNDEGTHNGEPSQQIMVKQADPGHCHYEPGSACSLDDLDEEMLMKIEEDAVREIALRKGKEVQGSTHGTDSKHQEDSRINAPTVQVSRTTHETAPQDQGIINSLRKGKAVQIEEEDCVIIASTAQVVRTTPETTPQDPGSINSSVTPLYRPPPRRLLRKPAIMRSPYVDFKTNNIFSCSKEVSNIYNVVVACQGRSTASSSIPNNDVIIINYWDFHVTLADLARSVKPRGDLINTVAEIGLYVINNTSNKKIKRVLPLRVAHFVESEQLDRTEVKRVFRRSTNHLDHRHLVMFPVLQVISSRNVDNVGHYFLLVLNLRSNRFEVLDSMRTMEDDSLRTCCNRIVTGIKKLWKMHYPDSKIVIDDYDIVNIGVSHQGNNNDCGFHMLMHAEHWDGRTVYNFQAKDMPNIRKLLTYKWLTFEENDTDWKTKLNLS
ncbi:unnamed protein product [Urochloa decumbens]|uniref:Ubiquitin-like protease family profile domain-containing protein n=1 Tax=Urochloa decumbens TaxID=240449 RepID=A0ABC8XF88_9POAL